MNRLLKGVFPIVVCALLGFAAYTYYTAGTNGAQAATGHIVLTKLQPTASFVVQGQVEGNDVGADGVYTNWEVVSFADPSDLPADIGLSELSESVTVHKGDLGDGRVVVEFRLERPELAPLEVHWHTSLIGSDDDDWSQLSDLADADAWVDLYNLEISEAPTGRMWPSSTTWAAEAALELRDSVLVKQDWDVFVPSGDAEIMVGMGSRGSGPATAWLVVDDELQALQPGFVVPHRVPENCASGCSMTVTTMAKPGHSVTLYGDAGVKVKLGGQVRLTSQDYAVNTFLVPAAGEPGANEIHDVEVWLASTVQAEHASTTFVQLEVLGGAGQVTSNGQKRSLVPFGACCDFAVTFDPETEGERVAMALRYYYVVEPDRVRTGFALPETVQLVEN